MTNATRRTPARIAALAFGCGALGALGSGAAARAQDSAAARVAASPEVQDAVRSFVHPTIEERERALADLAPLRARHDAQRRAWARAIDCTDPIRTAAALRMLELLGRDATPTFRSVTERHAHWLVMRPTFDELADVSANLGTTEQAEQFLGCRPAPRGIAPAAVAIADHRFLDAASIVAARLGPDVHPWMVGTLHGPDGPRPGGWAPLFFDALARLDRRPDDADAWVDLLDTMHAAPMFQEFDALLADLTWKALDVATSDLQRGRLFLLLGDLHFPAFDDAVAEAEIQTLAVAAARCLATSPDPEWQARALTRVSFGWPSDAGKEVAGELALILADEFRDTDDWLANAVRASWHLAATGGFRRGIDLLEPWLSQAPAREPDQGFHWDHHAADSLATLHEAVGDTEAAIDWLHRALDDFPVGGGCGVLIVGVESDIRARIERLEAAAKR